MSSQAFSGQMSPWLSSECVVGGMLQLPQGSGKELSSGKEQFPKLPELGNAAHCARRAQVSANCLALSFQLIAV